MFETKEEFRDFLKKSNKEITIIKFTASWCGPCTKIHPLITELIQHYKDKEKHYRFIEIDIDNCKEIYSFFKKRRMVNGIPSFCLYYKSKFDEETFYVPHKTVIGANPQQIIQLFSSSLDNLP